MLLVIAVGYRLLSDRPAEGPAVTVDGVPAGSASEAVAGDAAAGEAGRMGGEATGRRLYVHVAGAVRRPGLYRLAPGARVAAAVELAGGPRRRADLTATNLAAPAEDGQQIVVARRGGGAAGGVAGPAVAGTGGAAGGGAISLARATQADLEAIDGIGPTLAARIIEYRDTNGGFRSVEELAEVDGIGEVRLEALREAARP